MLNLDRAVVLRAVAEGWDSRASPHGGDPWTPLPCGVRSLGSGDRDGAVGFLPSVPSDKRIVVPVSGEAECLALWRGIPLGRQAFFRVIGSQVPQKQGLVPDAQVGGSPW